MDFNKFISSIEIIKNIELGGLHSQFKLAPKMRLNYSKEMIAAKNPMKAAVLSLFYPDTNFETRILLTLRASYNGIHSAQISFPGGKIDQNDANLKETALRETFEEVGIDKNNINIIKQMTNVYIPPSNFIVSPFLGILNNTPDFITNHEVENLIEVKLSDLLNDRNITTKKLSTTYASNIEVPCYKLNDYIIWGATAMMLSEIKDLIIKTS